MIGYVTLGVSDIERASAFYDALLAELGAKRFMEFPGFITWATSPTAPALAICKPYNGEAATVGNGVMVALSAGSEEKVQAIHAKALELGAAGHRVRMPPRGVPRLPLVPPPLSPPLPLPPPLPSSSPAPAAGAPASASSTPCRLVK